MSKPTEKEISRVMAELGRRGLGVSRNFSSMQRKACSERLAVARLKRWPKGKAVNQ